MIAALTTLALVLSAVAAHRLAGRLSLDLPAHGRSALAGSLFVALILVPVGLAGRAAEALDVGIVAWATTVLAVVAAERVHTRRVGPPVVAPSSPLGPWVVAASLLMLAIYAVLAFKYQMHDEHPIFGHKSMVEELRAGEYPPYFPPLPNQHARYHYGFDVLAGVLARAYGLSSDLAIDVTMLGLVFLLSGAAAAITADAGAPRAAPFAALAIHLGAGLSWLTLAGVEGRHPRCLIQYHHPSCGVELFPTPILNLFQHPVSVGVPLMLVMWILARRLIEDDRWQRWAAALVLVLPALALGQIVYFVLGVLAALSGAGLAALRSRRWGGLIRLVLVVLVSLLVARALGGMLEPIDNGDPRAVARRRVIGFPSPELIPIARHHLANLGVGLVVLPFVAWVGLRRRSFLLVSMSAFVVGALIVFHVYVYTRSWDIVKFPSAAAFVLTLVYVIGVDDRLRGRGVLLPWLRRGGRALLLGSGILAVIWLAFPLEGDKRLYDPGTYRVDPMVAQSIGWLRAHDYQRRELVLSQSNVAVELAVFGGLSVIASDSDLFSMGIRMEDMRAQETLAGRARQTMDRGALDALGVRWLVYSDEELRNLGPLAQRALTSSATPGLREVATFEAGSGRRRRIWRVE